MTLLQSLASPIVVILFASLLLVLAVGTAVWWGRICTSLIAPLQAARAIVAGTADRLAFGAEFPTLHERLAWTLTARPSLATAWERLSEKMTREALPNQRFLMHAEQPPENFFNAPDLLRAEPVHWFRSLPNYLIGIGLCFTFMGVTLVIYNASLALAMDGTPAMQTRALQELLHAAAFKFITSLCGILCSIAYSIWYRWQSLRLEREIADFVGILECRIQVWRTGVLLHRTWTEQQIQNSWLASIAGSLGGNATGRIEVELDRLAQSLENFSVEVAEKLEASNNQGLERLVDLTAKQMNRAVEAHVQSIGATLNLVQERLLVVVDSFADISTTFARLNSEFAGIQQQASEQAQTLGDSMQSAANSAGQVQNAFVTAHEGMARLTDLSASLEKSVTLWSSLSERIGGISVGQTDAATKIQEATGAMKTLWENQARHLAGADTVMATTISGLEDVFGRYGKALQEYTGGLDTHLVKALQGLEGCVRQMNECPEQLRAAAFDLQRTIADSMRGLQNLPVDRIKELSQSLTDAANALAASCSAANRTRESDPFSPPFPPGPTKDGLLVP